MAGIPGWTNDDSTVNVFYTDSAMIHTGLAEAFFDRSLSEISVGDKFVFKNADVDGDDIEYDAGTGTVTVDVDGDGEADGTFSLDGDLEDGTLLAVHDGTNTVLSFEAFLPDLEEGIALAPGAVNGISNQSFLTGRDGVDFKVALNSDLSSSTLNNTLGVYEIDETGNIVDVRLLVGDVNAESDATVDVSGVESGHRLGFFLVQNGADWAGGLDSSDVLSFVDSSGGTGSAEGGVPLSLAVNGTIAELEVFHTFGQGLNSDGLQHVVSGVDPSGEGLVIGFEDMVGGDNDYQDLVFSVFEI